MPRAPKYKKEETLDRALHHFWQNGYLNTSIEDLVEATGVQRYGLYQHFGSKHDLFLAALRRYEEVYISHRLRDLESEDAGIDAIESVINNLTVFADSPLGRFGCLLCNTAVELGGRDETVDTEVNHYATRLRNAFAKAVTTAQSDGAIDPSADPDSLADFLAGIVIGACVYARTQAQKGSVRAMLETALDRLPLAD
jgi:TetR/AcrR family transcriptional regulator, transcriptional repressor for nem operon